LELQPDYFMGNWVKGLSECCAGRYEDAVKTLEQVTSVSRSPMFIGMTGMAYALAGRPQDAIRLLNELEERCSRGEYVPAFSRLPAYTGLSDIPAIRRTLSRAVAESTPAFDYAASCAKFLDEFRTDPEINRMLVEIFGY
jgi:hypothetical protein